MSDDPAPLATVDEQALRPDLPDNAQQMRLLAEIRRATARYHRVEAAEADGYVLSSECVASPAGGMGHHFVKGPLVDGVVEPTMPEALVYEPQSNGRLRLVAVEYIVVAAAWDATHDSPPMLGSVVFDDHRPEGSGGPPFPHYQLHAWIWKHNPAGMHAPFNPNVNCAYALDFPPAPAE
ncbi:hypothetical protein [Pontibacter flavimaris]|uniref:Uncharacterized protein n=1 Tax=Pontibacter flavimaris TaxID=1797110 RepID=A0A1Q5P931_9BACT|nr:hypothetical protein [Pontibacter flavimaris]OKL38704.1 hypothetical protein A3841_06080 [Pontibacter flavimaris]